MTTIRFGNKVYVLPGSRLARIGLGLLLIIGGILGFLPVLGFWMIPLGLFVLSVDLPAVRRKRRRLAVWWHRRNGNGRKNGNGTGNGNGKNNKQ